MGVGGEFKGETRVGIEMAGVWLEQVIGRSCWMALGSGVC